MRTVKRRRRSTVLPGSLIAAASLAAGVSLAHAATLVWVSLIIAAATAAYTLGRLSDRKPARKASTEFAERKRAAQRAASTRATGRGQVPPASPDLLPMMISEYCSDGQCGICPGNGCEHDCRHDPAVIVARNKAEYDREHS